MSLTQKTIDIPIKNIKMSAGQLLKQANQFKRLGKLDSAIAEYKKSVDLNPHFAWSHCQLAQVLEKTGNLEEACIEYQKAIEINPYATSIYYRLGVALDKAGQLNEAISILKKVIEIQPSFYLAYKTLADNYKKLGNLEEGLTYFQNLKEINSEISNVNLIINELIKTTKLLNSIELISGKLEFEKFADTTWRFGRIDGSRIADVILQSDGRIQGLKSENEYWWNIEEKTLIFYTKKGQTSTKFSSIVKEDNHWYLMGKFLFFDGIIHTLKLLNTNSKEAYQNSSAKNKLIDSNLSTNCLVSSTYYSYSSHLLDNTLFDIFIRQLKATTNLSRFQTAIVGYDSNLFFNRDSLHDFGIIVNDSDENTSFYQDQQETNSLFSKSLAHLDLSQYELIILCENNPENTTKIFEKLGITSEKKGTPKLGYPVFNINFIRSNIFSVLSKLKFFHTCLNPRKVALLALALCQTRSVEGSVIEVGTYMGGASVFMGMLLKEWSDPRKIHIFDTFEGLPTPSQEDHDCQFKQGDFKETSYEFVQEYVREYKLDSTITLYKGLVQEKIPILWRKEKQVSLALIDTDYYTGAFESLVQIIPQMSRNGIIVIDDYSFSGITKAIDDIKQIYPQVQGSLITSNVYMIWVDHDESFLSIF
ncbi:TylF/MycF/NovP-related O-methyltransferase [Planktothrix agardhii]|uniref:Uncharacterized protein n=1 Tax=Planktothrix agardhii (strain NIVA-CYA 126/8) TaxID=388467 RepID=A0A073CCL0_PLAA1|nr:TylF/MycF/NovP-related O-methyltransferase [Planktothrix agardhii]KEI66069.1 hypothetical protein A19Y_0938 [Planktothrix agardhii NIVA-CYA 126/8]CAD5923770.1 8-demethyl-8-(2,3-dimethoxy-alpha-L-rhamnosyl)-tetracenomycin-C 4'-O-methyltransferase [Planktothrix agardhii]